MASSIIFLSSPPHPPQNQRSQASTSHDSNKNTFFTPQHHRTYNWSSRAWAPTSPSPLRTSRNANLGLGFMASARGGEGIGNGKVGGLDSENAFIERTSSRDLFGASGRSQGQGHGESKPSIFDTPSPTTDSNAVFEFMANTPTHNNDAQTQVDTEAASNGPKFAFSARARNASPAALLHAHARESRDSRRRVFLDRLRNQRDDVRGERLGDQVLRMDFMRERRKWVALKEAVDVNVNLEGVEDADEDMAGDFEDGGNGGELSPTDAWDGDVEELAGRYYALQREGRALSWEMHAQRDQRWDSARSDASANEQNAGAEFEFSDDGYDEAFMEVLSQEVDPSHHQTERNGNVNGNTNMNATTSESMSRRYGDSTGFMGSVDSEMDM